MPTLSDVLLSFDLLSIETISPFSLKLFFMKENSFYKLRFIYFSFDHLSMSLIAYVIVQTFSQHHL